MDGENDEQGTCERVVIYAEMELEGRESLQIHTKKGIQNPESKTCYGTEEKKKRENAS